MKRLCADDSAATSVKVGYRQASYIENPLKNILSGFFALNDTTMQVMRYSFSILTSLLALKVLLYLPVIGFVYAGWETCGRHVWAAPNMVAIQGILDEATYDARSVGKRDMLDIRIAYTYHHDDRVYSSDRMVFCPAWSDALTFDGLTAMFESLPRIGLPITIWVDPAKPEDAVLFRYVPRAAMLILGFGGLLLVVFTVSLDRRSSAYLRQLFETQSDRDR